MYSSQLKKSQFVCPEFEIRALGEGSSFPMTLCTQTGRWPEVLVDDWNGKSHRKSSKEADVEGSGSSAASASQITDVVRRYPVSIISPMKKAPQN